MMKSTQHKNRVHRSSSTVKTYLIIRICFNWIIGFAIEDDPVGHWVGLKEHSLTCWPFDVVMLCLYLSIL